MKSINYAKFHLDFLFNPLNTTHIIYRSPVIDDFTGVFRPCFFRNKLTNHSSCLVAVNSHILVYFTQYYWTEHELLIFGGSTLARNGGYQISHPRYFHKFRLLLISRQFLSCFWWICLLNHPKRILLSKTS